MFVYHPISSIFLLRISFLQIFSPYARVFVCVCVGHIPLQSSIFKARYNANINYKYSAVFITHTSRFFTFVWCYSMYAVFFFCCLSSSICCFPFAYFVWCVWWKSVVYIPFQPSFYPPHQICCYFCVLSMNFRSFIRSNSLPTLYHRATIISFYFYLFRKCLSVCVCLYFSEVKRLRIFFFLLFRGSNFQSLRFFFIFFSPFFIDLFGFGFRHKLLVHNPSMACLPSEMLFFLGGKTRATLFRIVFRPHPLFDLTISSW